MTSFMLRASFCTPVVAGCLAAACKPSKPTEVVAPPNVGAPVANPRAPERLGTVRSVQSVGQCFQVTIEYPSDWVCTARQQQLVQGFLATFQ